MRHFLYGGAPVALLLALVMLGGSETRAQMPSQRGATSKIQGRYNALGGEIFRPGMGYYYAPVIGGVRNNQRSNSYSSGMNWSTNATQSGRSFSYAPTPATNGPCEQQNAEKAQPATPPPPVPDKGK